MNFGQAIEALKAGKKVSREGWNGKNMWLCYMPPFVVENPNERTQAHGITDPFECGGYIVMWTAQKVWQPGWLASQADMLAEDWGIVRYNDKAHQREATVCRDGLCSGGAKW